MASARPGPARDRVSRDRVGGRRPLRGARPHPVGTGLRRLPGVRPRDRGRAVALVDGPDAVRRREPARRVRVGRPLGEEAQPPERPASVRVGAGRDRALRRTPARRARPDPVAARRRTARLRDGCPPLRDRAVRGARGRPRRRLRARPAGAGRRRRRRRAHQGLRDRALSRARPRPGGGSLGRPPALPGARGAGERRRYPAIRCLLDGRSPRRAGVRHGAPRSARDHRAPGR